MWFSLQTHRWRSAGGALAYFILCCDSAALYISRLFCGFICKWVFLLPVTQLESFTNLLFCLYVTNLWGLHIHTLWLGKILGKCGILKYLCYSQVFPVYANLYFFSSTFQSETLYFLTPKVIKYIIKLSHNIQQLKLAPPRPATTLN